jgi:hypothetical protein
MYATVVAVESNVEYNNIQADAAQVITTAAIYLQSAELQSNPQNPAMVMNTVPDDLMDVGNVGEQIPSNAATDNNPDMQEETPSDAAIDNDPGMQVVDEQVLEINILQEEMNLLCTETVEDPSESPTTDDLRDRMNLLHHEPANMEPVADDIEMIEKPQGESDTTDTTPEEEIVSNTVQLDSQDNGAAQIPDPLT